MNSGMDRGYMDSEDQDTRAAFGALLRPIYNKIKNYKRLLRRLHTFYSTVTYLSFNLIEIVVSSYSVIISIWSRNSSKRDRNIRFQKNEKFSPRLCLITIQMFFCCVAKILASVPISYLLILETEFNADSLLNSPPRRRIAFFGSPAHSFTKSSKLSLPA
jgi:hypothetical protein